MSMKHHYLKKENFCSHLNMEDITDADFAHAKRLYKDFEIKMLIMVEKGIRVGIFHSIY